MMEPPPTRRIAGSTARDIKNGPFRFVARTRSHSSSLILSTVETLSAPALFTRTSIRPKAFSVSSAALRPSSSRVTSAARAMASPPTSLISFTTPSRDSRRRPKTATLAPPAARPKAIARPIPDPPPVTIVTLPFNRVTISLTLASNRCTIPAGALPPAVRDSNISPCLPASKALRAKMTSIGAQYAYWHYRIPYLRWLWGRRHGAWPRARRARPRRLFHHLRPSHPDENQRPSNPLSPGSGGFLSVV